MHGPATGAACQQHGRVLLARSIRGGQSGWQQGNQFTQLKVLLALFGHSLMKTGRVSRAAARNCRRHCSVSRRLLSTKSAGRQGRQAGRQAVVAIRGDGTHPAAPSPWQPPHEQALQAMAIAPLSRGAAGGHSVEPTYPVAAPRSQPPQSLRPPLLRQDAVAP